MTCCNCLSKLENIVGESELKLNNENHKVDIKHPIYTMLGKIKDYSNCSYCVSFGFNYYCTNEKILEDYLYKGLI